jgi:hypothetical protein
MRLSPLVIMLLLIAPHATSGDDSDFLQQLKQNPAGSPEAARWFAKLPTEKKRAYAARIGQIVLQGAKPEDFVVAFGSNQSPYRWVFIVGKDDLRLCEHNSLRYFLRDDKYVKKQWGVEWEVEQDYGSKMTASGIVFQKEPELKGTAGFDLWIPASEWKYVGPKLQKERTILRTPDLPPG